MGMSGFIDYRQHPKLAELVASLTAKWEEMFREAVHGMNLFIKSPEIHIQNPDDIRLFVVPLKWHGVMAGEHGQLCTGQEIMGRMPVATRLTRNPMIVSALYSMSMPGCEITPHLDNVESIGDVWRVHIGLSCPADCGLMVAGDVRQWHDGEALVFDSARVEHSAWNRSSNPRLVLIVDVDRKAVEN